MESGSRRVARVEEGLRQSLAKMLVTDLRGYLKGLVTVTHVRMPADLKSARVFVSVLGSEDDAQETIEFLKENAGEIQGRVGRSMQLKFCPKLTFQLDRTADESERVQRLIKQISQESPTKDDEGDNGDS